MYSFQQDTKDSTHWETRAALVRGSKILGENTGMPGTVNFGGFHQVIGQAHIELAQHEHGAGSKTSWAE